jgi:flagellar biosynthesis protein FliP
MIPDNLFDHFSSDVYLNILAITIISLIPILLATCTSFTRFAISFSFLKNAIGMQTAPSSIILIALSVFMTLLVMNKTFNQSYNNGIEPYLQKKIDLNDALNKTIIPFKSFMRENINNNDLKFIQNLSHNSDFKDDSLIIIVPTFMLSEIKKGFQVGLLITLPFLAIDLIVATTIMSLGMMMLPPAIISLPLKVLFFISIDGWSLFISSLVNSYN